ncbi:class I SAM-dependent methyltransferase [Rhizobium terrae]|uniref:class I SAM-dependent methyltransferase n=1 Tax=Rhizobium terrae TaxID=2171756 RepID=UPI0019685B15|nr:class I SAM-dependent methyltransferase [Rhizobium terrae]
MSKSGLPSIWLEDYSSWGEWDSVRADVAANSLLLNEEDYLHIHKPKRFSLRAFCSCCSEHRDMTFDWSLTFAGNGNLYIAWTELLLCQVCGMNSRMRAVWDFVANKLELPPGAKIYLPEAITPGFQQWKRRFPSAVGSEYVSPDVPAGSLHAVGTFSNVRHEDLTQLSFADDSFDLIISQDVFEHIPDFRSSFAECCRVLRKGGKLLFTVPFFPDQKMTEIRAILLPDGSVHSDFPLEYHGNPMSSGGSLCFQHFGWSMLDDLRAAGFSQAAAHNYWGPTFGHLGSPFFVFTATK